MLIWFVFGVVAYGVGLMVFLCCAKTPTQFYFLHKLWTGLGIFGLFVYGTKYVFFFPEAPLIAKVFVGVSLTAILCDFWEMLRMPATEKSE